MSEMIDAAIAALREKMDGESFDGSARFVIEGEGSIRIDESGVSESDAPADVTMTADADVFRGILEGTVNPTAAFMGGDLAVEGDTAKAMQLGAILS